MHGSPGGLVGLVFTIGMFGMACSSGGGGEGNPPASYAISGTVTRSTGGPLAGITVRLGGAATATTTTGASGDYSFTVSNGLSYTVTPTMAGWSFTPDHVTTIVAGTVTTANFAGSSVRVQDVVVNGTVRYPTPNAGRTGRVFVTLRWPWQSGGDVAAGTSLAAPGPFALHVEAADPLPRTAVLTVWMDALGIDKCNAAADPLAIVDPLSLGSTAVSLGTVDLVDPSGVATVAPVAVAPLPLDRAVGLIWNGPRDGTSGCEAADHYRIYWSAADPVPGPTSHDGSLTVPAGPDFGVAQGLTNGQAPYFSVASVVGASESDPTPFGTIAVGQYAPPGHAVTGTVGFAAPGVASALYVYGQLGSSNGPVNVTRVEVSAAATSATYALPLPDSGTPYQLAAFLDVGRKGFVTVRDPGMFSERVPAELMMVNGADAVANPFAIPSGKAVVRVATVRLQTAGGGPADALLFQASGNLGNPVAAQVTAGPIVAVPIDLGLSGGGGPGATYAAYRLLAPTTPVVGDAYTVHVTYADGSAEDLARPITAFYPGMPTPTDPADGSTGQSRTPTLAWIDPFPAPSVDYWHFIEIWPVLGGNGPSVGPLPSYQLALPWSAVDPAPLAPTTEYLWRISVLDAYGNMTGREATFTTGP